MRTGGVCAECALCSSDCQSHALLKIDLIFIVHSADFLRDCAFQSTHWMPVWNVLEQEKDASPAKRDLKMDALADVLRGKLLVQIHCYRADELLTEIRNWQTVWLQSAGLPSRAGSLQNSRPNDVGIATFADRRQIFAARIDHRPAGGSIHGFSHALNLGNLPLGIVLDQEFTTSTLRLEPR